MDFTDFYFWCVVYNIFKLWRHKLLWFKIVFSSHYTAWRSYSLGCTLQYLIVVSTQNYPKALNIYNSLTGIFVWVCVKKLSVFSQLSLYNKCIWACLFSAFTFLWWRLWNLFSWYGEGHGFLLMCSPPVDTHVAPGEDCWSHKHGVRIFRWHFVALQWFSTSLSKKAHDVRTEQYFQ